MSSPLVNEIRAALSAFGNEKRLYEFNFARDDSGKDLGNWLVEAFAADEGLNQIGWRDIILLATNARIKPADLLGKAGSLKVSLADRSRAVFSGFASNVEVLGSDGGLARIKIRLRPWIWLLSQASNNRVWQDKSVPDIIDAVFADYAPLARWRWSDETGPFMDGAVPRSYCCQYRETDLAFVERLLNEEGLAQSTELKRTTRFSTHDVI